MTPSPMRRLLTLLYFVCVYVAQLEKNRKADALNQKISHRPSPDQLIKEGVLHEDPRSPEEKYAEAIEDEYAKREGGA